MKKMLTFLFSLSCFSFAYGDYCLDGCSSMSYEMYGEIQYLQPNINCLNYGVEATASNHWRTLEIDPKYQLGFKVGAKGYCGNSCVNLDLNWQHLYSKDSDSSHTSSARGCASSYFDQINLNLGYLNSFCNNLYANFFSGINGTYIKQTMHSRFSNIGATIVRDLDVSSTFLGIGPQIGVNYDYRICSDFFLTGHSTFSLSVGRMKNHTQDIRAPRRTQVVPGFAQKLGVSYITTCDCCQITFGIGYQVQIYVNAVQTVDRTDVGFKRTLSNYMLNGPYAVLNIEF